jgi:hypothetical protein
VAAGQGPTEPSSFVAGTAELASIAEAGEASAHRRSADTVLQGQLSGTSAARRNHQGSAANAVAVHFFQHFRGRSRKTRQDHVEVIEKNHSILDARG